MQRISKKMKCDAYINKLYNNKQVTLEEYKSALKAYCAVGFISYEELIKMVDLYNKEINKKEG